MSSRYHWWTLRNLFSLFYISFGWKSSRVRVLELFLNVLINPIIVILKPFLLSQYLIGIYSYVQQLRVIAMF